MTDDDALALWHATLERGRVPQLLATLSVQNRLGSYTLRIAWRCQSDGLNRSLRIRSQDGTGAVIKQRRSHAATSPHDAYVFDGRRTRHVPMYEDAAINAPGVSLNDFLQPHPDDYDVVEGPNDPAYGSPLELRAAGNRAQEPRRRVWVDPAGPKQRRVRYELGDQRTVTYDRWTPVGDYLLATGWTVDQEGWPQWRVELMNVDTSARLPDEVFEPSAISRPF